MSGLAARNLIVTRGTATLLSSVDCSCAPGRVTAIIGPNGAGKSTLLSHLAGLEAPQSGEVTLDDAPLTSLTPTERARRIGYLPQGQDVHWDIDVMTLAMLGRLPHRGRFGGVSAADRAAVDQALASTQMHGLAQRAVSTLSGGERARALLARLLAGEPDWLLIDEPLASLDIGQQLAVLRLLRAAADHGAGVVMVVHDLTHAMNHADHVVLLDKGALVAAGAPQDVLTPFALRQVYGVDAQWLDQDGHWSLSVR